MSNPKHIVGSTGGNLSLVLPIFFINTNLEAFMGIIHKTETLDSSTAKIDMAIDFLEEALTELKQIDRDGFPDHADYLAELQPILWKLDEISAKLEKEASKTRGAQ